MKNYSRIAIYCTPDPDSHVAAFGAAWLGWDLHSGKSAPQMRIDGFDLGSITKRPRKYGFHGTLKAPFRLVEGVNEDAVLDAAHEFARHHAPLDLDRFELARLGRFLALRPVAQAPNFTDMAGEIVEWFEPFRAVSSPEELARRRKTKLSARQEGYLEEYGHPFVKEDFRFHMTLTGPLDDTDAVREVLTPMLAPFLSVPWWLDALSICGEREDGFFEEIARIPFRH